VRRDLHDRFALWLAAGVFGLCGLTLIYFLVHAFVAVISA
jgi:hypothetical protein